MKISATFIRISITRMKYLASHSISNIFWQNLLFTCDFKPLFLVHSFNRMAYKKLDRSKNMKHEKICNILKMLPFMIMCMWIHCYYFGVSHIWRYHWILHIWVKICTHQWQGRQWKWCNGWWYRWLIDDIDHWEFCIHFWKRHITDSLDNGLKKKLNFSWKIKV